MGGGYSVEYWDQRYEKQRKEHGLDFAYEWYCDLETGNLQTSNSLASLYSPDNTTASNNIAVESHLAMVVLEYKMPRILIVGCGNSRLGEMM